MGKKIKKLKTKTKTQQQQQQQGRKQEMSMCEVRKYGQTVAFMRTLNE